MERYLRHVVNGYRRFAADTNGLFHRYYGYDCALTNRLSSHLDSMSPFDIAEPRGHTRSQTHLMKTRLNSVFDELLVAGLHRH